MRTHTLLIAAATALALAPFALVAKEDTKAQAPAMSAMPAELAQLDVFAGHWNCSGKAFANPMGPEHATTATVHAARAVGGRWMQAAYDENQSAANPMPFHAVMYMGYDVGQKKFVAMCFDNFGGECSQTADGWNGDELVFEGTAHGDDGKTWGARDTFTKKGTAELMHAGEMQGEDKAWIKLDEETCHKGK
jgi:hypothetical protein